MLRARQFGVCVPGGAEALIHARSVIEQSAQASPDAGVWAAIDVDFVNFYPSLEWDDIEDEIETHLPDIVAWTRWCHEIAADIDLPCGETYLAARGAEQGDPHAS